MSILSSSSSDLYIMWLCCIGCIAIKGQGMSVNIEGIMQIIKFSSYHIHKDIFHFSRLKISQRSLAKTWPLYVTIINLQ